MKRKRVGVLGSMLAACSLLFFTEMTASANDDITGITLESEMRSVVDQGIMQGYGDGIYKPFTEVTRGQFAALLARALELPEGEPQFSDVPQTSKLANEIYSASAARIVKGYENGNFGINDNITREQMAQMIDNSLDFLNVKRTEAPLNFTDESSISKTFKRAVSRTVYDGIVKGNQKENGTYDFLPKKTATRAEAAAFISRMLHTYKEFIAQGQDGQPIPPVEEPPVEPEQPPVDSDKGWVQEGGNWYFIQEDGAMHVGWLEDEGKWYYFNNDGKMMTGKHTISGVVYEFSANGVLNKGSVTTSTRYNISLQEMINKQLSVLPKTDKYRNDKTYVHSDYIQLELDPINSAAGTALTGTVTTASLNVREGNSEEYRVVGTLKTGDTVNILSVADEWYEISYGAWRYAKPEDVAYYVNPENFPADSAAYYQFLLLSKNTGASANELNKKILAGKGILDGKGQAFVDASLKEKINELYLISHALLETGNGTSQLSTGVLVESVNGKPVEPKVVYNMFGIQARDVDPIRLGAEYAYQNGWFTPEAAIIGGAKYIGESYIHNPTYQQDTLYEMRWNPQKPGTHQYATDIGWASKQVNNLKKLYDSLSWYTLHFDVPVYK